MILVYFHRLILFLLALRQNRFKALVGNLLDKVSVLPESRQKAQSGREQLPSQSGQEQNHEKIHKQLASLADYLAIHAQDFKMEVARENDPPPYFINPNSKFIARWNVCLLAGVCYISMTVPIAIGFGEEPGTFELVLDVFMDLFFITDVVVNFRTGSVLQGSRKVEYDFNTIALNYLSSWFLVDAVSSIPSALISLSTSTNTKHLVALKVVRFLKVIKSEK
jgi:hypothetical protein